MFTTVSALLTRLPGLRDHQAWTIFDGRYSTMLRRFFSSFGVTGELARDLTQDTIEKAIKGLRAGTYHREKGRLRDWMGGIAKNVLRDHWRKVGGAGGQVQAKTVFWEAREDPTAADTLRQVDQRFDEIWLRTRLSALIRYARRSFSHRDLRCYFLIEVHRRPIAEVGRRLGMSVSAVYQRRRAVATWFRTVGPSFVATWEK